MKRMTLIGLLCLAGCSNSHRVVNVGEHDVYAVNVKSKNQEFGHGFLKKDCAKSYYGRMKILKSPDPIVSWKNDEDGTVLYRTVELERSSGGRWVIVFELDGSNVWSRLEKQ